MVITEELIFWQCLSAIAKYIHQDGRVGDAIYARALAEFGEQGIVDMIGLSGYYTLIAMFLNTAQTPLASGVTPALEPFAR